jgi:Zn-dependent protease
MDLLLTILTLIILLFSIIIHEISHGTAAYYLGDPTAKMEGRLSLNPLKHLDPVGSIILPLFLMMLGGPVIGWAKPVPVNPAYFRDKRWGDLKVSLAGPASNFALALIFGLIVRFIPLPSGFVEIAAIVVTYNIALAIFNLIPLPPLDGSHILFSILPSSFDGLKVFLSQWGFVVLVFIIFLVPDSLNWIFTIAQNFLYLFLK